jgi:hypothetical protein
MSDLYYHPEHHGLEEVLEFDAHNAPWEFSLLWVVRETSTGKLYAATDEGCSCPVPFEDHTFPTDFTEVRSYSDVRELYNSSFYEPRPLPSDFRPRIEKELSHVEP